MHRDESIVENAALTWGGERRYAVGDGPQIASGQPAALMSKAILRQNTEFLFLPALRALSVSVFPILTPLCQSVDASTRSDSAPRCLGDYPKGSK